MKIKDLLYTNEIFMSYCGNCCELPFSCEKCLDKNLESNSIDTKYRDRFKGLLHRNSSYQFGENSEFAVAMGKFKAEVKKGLK